MAPEFPVAERWGSPHVRKTHAGASVLNDYRREDDFGSHAVMLCLLFLLLLVVSF